MIHAILIGFEYTFNSLTGALIDLYQAYNWCSLLGCTITVLTDIANSNKTHIDSLITAGIVDKDIYQLPLTVIRTQHELLTAVKSVALSVRDKLIIYYSGHGVRDCMVMPDKSLLAFISFRDHILAQLGDYVEIFWILDCCNPNGLHLPYKLADNTFKLSTSAISFVTQPIILITSSEDHEKSVATKNGSVFSKYLFKILTSFTDTKNRNLRRLIGTLASSIRKLDTGYNQTVSIYSSYVIDPVLWLWIGRPHDIVTDVSLSMLVIRQ